jgi:hypothetical protein
MRQKTIFTILFLLIAFGIKAQTVKTIGGGIFTEGNGRYGALLEIEREKKFTEEFSLPCKLDISYFSSSDYNYWAVEIRQDFRRYFKSGLFCEQGVGLGILANYFNPDIYFYSDKYMSSLINDKKAKIGVQPLVTCGIGYNFSKDKNALNAIWIRPKIYWNLKIRGLHLPYCAVQIGFSHSLKGKSDK